MAAVHPRVLNLFLAFSVLASCTTESSGPDAYLDGESKMGVHGAFAVTLFHEDGAPARGSNDFVVRFAMVDPARPDDEGRGVPGLVLTVDAWMPGAAHRSARGPAIHYEGDGNYRLAGIELDEEGWWRLDMEARRGSITEEVRFDFPVEGP